MACGVKIYFFSDLFTMVMVTITIMRLQTTTSWRWNNDTSESDDVSLAQSDIHPIKTLHSLTRTQKVSVYV